VDNQLYIRVRGRVLGPYDEEKLQGLARRGQLSRMHELSPDGVNWVRATNYPELFVGEVAAIAVVETAVPTAQVFQSSPEANPAGQRSPPGQQVWHYTNAGVQRGPVDFANLQLLVAMGQVAPDDLVWNDGMTAWTPAGHVPGLIRQGANHVNVGPGEPANDRSLDPIPDYLAKSATSSRSWLTLLVILIGVYALLEAIGGMYLLILGARMQATSLVASGVFSLMWAIDWAVGAYLLNAYNSRLASLQYKKNARVLEKSLDTLRPIWIYACINLIVMLAFIAFVAVWAFAVGVTFPRFQ
jgi:hypothetical protein